jgi:hypothetical protein
MKQFLTIFSIIFFLLISDCFAQEDTTTIRKQRTVDVEDEIIPELERDKKKKKDVFIDRDGDGICDERAEGMSFEKLRKRKRSGQGQGGSGGRQN